MPSALMSPISLSCPDRANHCQRTIGNCATSSLLHLPIGNAVTGGDQRFQIENRDQPLPMLQHLGPQFLQRRLLAQRWIDRVLIELDRRQPRVAVHGAASAAKWAAFSKHLRTSSSGALALRPVCASE